jgi:hypothetical protein
LTFIASVDGARRIQTRRKRKGKADVNDNTTAEEKAGEDNQVFIFRHLIYQSPIYFFIRWSSTTKDLLARPLVLVLPVLATTAAPTP